MKNDPLIDYKDIYIYILLFVIIRWYHSMVCQKSAVRLTKLADHWSLFWYFLLNLGTCWVPGWHVDGPWVGRAIHGTDLLHLQCHYQIWRIVVAIGLLTLGPKTCCFKDDRNYSRNFLVPSNIIKHHQTYQDHAIQKWNVGLLDNGRWAALKKDEKLMLRQRGNALEERLTVTGRGRRGGTALTSLRPGATGIWNFRWITRHGKHTKSYWKWPIEMGIL